MDAMEKTENTVLKLSLNRAKVALKYSSASNSKSSQSLNRAKVALKFLLYQKELRILLV